MAIGGMDRPQEATEVCVDPRSLSEQVAALEQVAEAALREGKTAVTALRHALAQEKALRRDQHHGHDSHSRHRQVVIPEAIAAIRARREPLNRQRQELVDSAGSSCAVAGSDRIRELFGDCSGVVFGGELVGADALQPDLGSGVAAEMSAQAADSSAVALAALQAGALQALDAVRGRRRSRSAERELAQSRADPKLPAVFSPPPPPSSMPEPDCDPQREQSEAAAKRIAPITPAALLQLGVASAGAAGAKAASPLPEDAWDDL
eukprot:TRINITY_DN28053_c0_g1_i1.p2 TRINITY_DN28053_c0_g1~~TRINITY_DN28053_c0_g1_i1.p2  ORF type:complete len:278 (+),score=76.01 TRINITY_DN28053_c0_g1_i1:47-835(+)